MLKKRLFAVTLILSLALAGASSSSAQWVRTNGPYGGAVKALAVNGTILFAGMYYYDQIAVYSSTDSGSTWAPAGAGIPVNGNLRALLVKGTELFAGIYEGGVYRSTDSGKSWISAIGSGLPEGYYIEALSLIGNMLMAGTDVGVYFSTNDGTTWVQSKNQLENSGFVLAVSGDTIFSGGDKGLFRSNDKGNTWESIGDPMGAHTPSAIALDRKAVFVGTYQGGVFLSTNNGNSWSAINNGLPSNSTISFLFVAGHTLCAGVYNYGLYVSTNQGIIWSASDSGLPSSSDVYSMVSLGQNLYVGNSTCGVFRSTDSGTNWNLSSIGLTNTNEIPCLYGFKNSLLAGGEGTFYTTDEGDNWLLGKSLSIPPGDISYTAMGDILFSSSYDGGVAISTDNGLNWAEADSGIPPNSYCEALLSVGTHLFVGASEEVYRSIDSGKSWTLASDSLTSSYYVSALASIGDCIFATYPNIIYLSTDDGNSWNSVIGSSDIAFNRLAVIGSYLFSGGNGVFLSKDKGYTWSEENLGLPINTYIQALATDGSNLFAATQNTGVYLSTNFGTNWTSISSGLLDTSIYSLAVYGTNIYAGTWRNGVWRRPLAEMIAPSSVASEKLPSETISVYPDPASSLVTIDCPNLKGATDASLISITGVTVWHRTLNADGRPFQLDFNGVANGAYRIELVAGDVRQTCNIVLNR